MQVGVLAFDNQIKFFLSPSKYLCGHSRESGNPSRRGKSEGSTEIYLNIWEEVKHGMAEFESVVSICSGRWNRYSELADVSAVR